MSDVWRIAIRSGALLGCIIFLLWLSGLIHSTSSF